MITDLVERLIQLLKRDRTYRIDDAIQGRVFRQILTYRSTSFMRGFWKRLGLREAHGPLFVGRHVALRHPQLINVGRSVILEDYVTIDALSMRGVVLGDNVTVARHVTIQCTGVIRRLGVGLTVGNNSAIGAYCFLGAQAGIEIGDDVIIGPRVSFHAENHKYGRLDVPIRLQGEARKGIVVEDDCWIGAGSIILDGVHVGTGSVIAAGSVVTRDISPHSVVAGVPARKLKERRTSVE